MTGFTYTISPGQAAQAYRSAASADQPGGSGPGFADLLGQAVNAAISQSHGAEAASAAVLDGQGNLTQAVTALAQAQLTLQTVTTLRDRMVSAYQDILRMPI